MKNKIFFGVGIALLLSMVMTGSLWAQELKFDGYINSGLGVVADDSKDNDVYYKAFGVDSDSNGYRFRLNGSYTNEAKNAGARFRLQSQRRLERANTGYFSMPYAYGWVGFFNNIINVTGGIVDDSTWQTAEWWWNDDQGEGLGLLLKAEPIKGLNLGVGIYTISQQSGGSNNILSTGNNASLPNFQDVTIRPEDAKYTFNAAYTMPDTFRLGVSFRTKNRAGWKPSTVIVDDTTDPAKTATGYTFDNYAYTGREEASQLIGEFRFLMLKDLTTVVAGVFDTLEKFDDAGNVTLSETFGYKLDSLSLGLNAVQFLYNRGKTDVDPGLLFNLWGSYAFDKIVPRLDLVYFMGGQSKTVLGDKQWERRGFTNTEKGAPDKDDDYSVFSVRPSVKFNIDSRTFLEIGDMINYDFANYDGYRKDGKAIVIDEKDPTKSLLGDTNSRLTNVFYIDVKWSF